MKIDFDNIEEVVLSKKNLAVGEQVKLALLNGLESHNVVIRLKKPVVVTKIFGIRKNADVILFHIDRAGDFEQSLKESMASSEMMLK